MSRTLALVVLTSLFTSAGVEAQMAHRLKGSLRTTANVPLGPDIEEDTRVAAGEMALVTRHHELARTLFDRALSIEPKHPRAKLAAAIDDLRGIARVQ